MKRKKQNDEMTVNDEKEKEKVEVTVISETKKSNVELNSPFQNRMAEHRALKRARQSLPNTPAKRARLIEKLATSPGCSKYISETSLATSEVEEFAIYGRKLVSSIKSLADETKTCSTSKDGKQQTKVRKESSKTTLVFPAGQRQRKKLVFHGGLIRSAKPAKLN